MPLLQAAMANSKDVEWYRVNRGLRSQGYLVSDITVEEVPHSLICETFGPKSSKSGWKYKNYTDKQTSGAITDLYRRIYEQEPNVTNCEISLGFARGLIRESKTHDVNWAEWAVKCREKREKTAAKKAQNRTLALKDHSKEDYRKGRDVLGPRQGLGFTNKENLPLLKLVKVEHLVMGKGRPSARGTIAPVWVEDELLDMETYLGRRSELLKKLKASLGEAVSKKTEVESQYRRCILECSDREVLYAQSKAVVLNSRSAASTIKEQIESIESLLSILKQTPSSDVDEKVQPSEASLKSLQGEHEQLLNKVSFGETTMKHYNDMLEVCRAKNLELEKSFEECSKESVEFSIKVSCLEKVLVGMGDQWEKMSEGGGLAAFPRPISADLETPIRTAISVNACPICKLWYSCYNHQFAECGHTYHPWCLAEYAKSATRCAVDGCSGPFSSSDWFASLGIRQVPTGEHCGTHQKRLKERSRCKEKIDTTFSPLNSGDHISSDERSEPLATAPIMIQTSSSESAETKKEAMLSQSEQGPIVSIGSTTSRDKVTCPSLCQVCLQKPPAITLQKCGHSSFCFTCLKGLQKCPICEAEITTWVPLKKKTCINPMVLSLGGAFDAAVDPLIPQPKKGPNQAKRLKTVESDNEGLKFDCMLDSDDDQDDGLVHWSSDDVHKEGGLRSVKRKTEGSNKRLHEGAVNLAVEIEGQVLKTVAAPPVKPSPLEKDFEVDDSNELPTKVNKPSFGNKNRKLKSLNVLQATAPSAEEATSSIVKERS